jgi:hypothetical protein
MLFQRRGGPHTGDDGCDERQQSGVGLASIPIWQRNRDATWFDSPPRKGRVSSGSCGGAAAARYTIAPQGTSPSALTERPDARDAVGARGVTMALDTATHQISTWLDRNYPPAPDIRKRAPPPAGQRGPRPGGNSRFVSRRDFCGWSE